MLPRWLQYFCALALLAAVAGCKASPWSAPTASSLAATPPPAGLPAPVAAAPGQPAAPQTSAAEMQQVMAEVRRLGGDDPALQAQLLGELEASDPTLWPLVVESLRSRVAYGRQLQQKEMLAGQRVEPNAALARDRSSLEAPIAQQPAASPQPSAVAPLGSASADGGSRIARLPVADQGILSPVWPAAMTGVPAMELTSAASPRGLVLEPPDRGDSNGGLPPAAIDGRPVSTAVHGPQLAADAPRTTTDELRPASYEHRPTAHGPRPTALGVRNLAFCREVQSFGSIRRFERDEFTPGQHVLLYAEIENFHSDPTPAGHHTSLRSSYRIVDAAGRPVAPVESTTTDDYCQSPRRDFFIGCDFRLPKTLGPGRHTLTLTVEDLKTAAQGEASIGFTVR